MPTNCVLFTLRICTDYTRENFVYEIISAWCTLGSETRVISIFIHGIGMEWNGIGPTRHGNAAPVVNPRSPALQIDVVHSHMVNRAVSPLCSYMQHTFPV